VLEDGIIHRDRKLTGEAQQGSQRKGILPDEKRFKKGRMPCRVADEPVVVMKFPPMKPGNGVEDKTEMTCGQVRRGRRRAKSIGGCEGVKFIRKSWRAIRINPQRRNRLTRRASTKRFPWEQGSSRKLLSQE